MIDGVPAEDVEVVSTSARKRQVPSSVILEFCPRAADGALDKALEVCARPRVLAAVPWRHAAVPPGCAYAESAAYVLPANALPEPRSFFPFNWRYASGFALVEIEPMLDDKTNAALSAEYFMTRQFQEKRTAITTALRGVSNSHGSTPGFILPDTSKHLAAYAHLGTARDPLLTQFRPDFARHSKLKLLSGDYIAFCTSTWANVSFRAGLRAPMDAASRCRSWFPSRHCAEVP